MLDYCAECGAEIFRCDEVLGVDDGPICKVVLSGAREEGFKADCGYCRAEPLLRDIKQRPGICLFH